ncbi:MAG: hypothetical protein IT422_28115 [Pirellulaceae bacterium]|nr:hypothetical protein [Pirellulaceae bacterium]
MSNASSDSLQPPASLTWPLDLLRRWTGLMAAVLIAATWPLWWGVSDFPAIPVAARFDQVPLWGDRVCCVALLIGTIVLIMGNQRASKWGWLCILASGILLALLDQHRWQPWFYQLLLYSSVFILGSPRTLARCLTWLTISIYFFSALGKLDAEFLHTVGQQFWQEMLQWVGQVHAVDEPWRERPMALIATLPAVEMLLAAGLAWPKTRRIAGVLAILFHLGLMCLLGPLGLDHSAGVLYWNLQFAGQALCLFVLLAPQNAPNPSVDAEETAGKRWKNRLAITITGLAIALPLGERRGLWDHWTSWALYAPHSSRTEVWIAFTTVDSLPASLQQVIAEERASRESLPEQQSERELDAPDEMPALWLRVPIERWSLAETRTPIYPQARFQLGVARALAAQIDSEFKVKCIVRSAAARWDGRRKSREYQGKSSIDSAAKNHWLGTTPR